MSQTDIRQQTSQRQIKEFERKFGRNTLHLAYHAALPVALNSELLHLLRINFFLDPPHSLPYMAEIDLLLSPLCQEIGEDLYEIDSTVRDELLKGLVIEYGHERLREVAGLLWEYIERWAPWADDIRLERAQQLTALNFIEPKRAGKWLEEAEKLVMSSRSVEREWFVAMGQEVKNANRSYMTEAAVTAFVEAVFYFLWNEVGVEERIRGWFKLDHRDPQQVAFKNAFQNAYQKLDQTYPHCTNRFFDTHFLLNRAAPLLARCLTRSGPPQPVELAVAWVEQLNLSADKEAIYIQEQTPAAADFLRWLDAELRASPEFRQIFDSYAWDVTASATTQMAVTIEKLNATVAALPDTHLQLIEVIQALSNQAMLARQQLSTPTVTVTRPTLPTNAPPAQLPPPRSGICPFEYGATVPPERFYGRHSQRADIKIRIGGISAQCVSIVGMRRSGKSSLLRYIKERLHEFCRPEQQAFVVTLDLHLKRFHTPEGLVEGLRRGIEKRIGHSPWERKENDDEWAVEDGLLALRETGKRLIVLMDEFDSLGSRLHVFQGWVEDWRSKAAAGYFALVIASLRPLDGIYQDDGLTEPFGNLFTQTALGAFSNHEWQKLVHEGFARNREDVSEEDLALIYDLAGGLPYYTQMAAALLWQHRDHTRTRSAFVHQARPRFTELWNDLKEDERKTLLHAVGVHTGTTPPNSYLRATLHRYGLLRANGQLFSSIFAEFVREQ